MVKLIHDDNINEEKMPDQIPQMEASSSAIPPTMPPQNQGTTKGSALDFMTNKASDLKDQVKEKIMAQTGMPEWGFVFVGIICLLIVLCCAYALIRKLFGKKRHGEKNKAKGFKGFFKNTADLGPAANKFQLQTDLDQLEENMEQNEKEQAEVKEEVNLGRIQYVYRPIC